MTQPQSNPTTWPDHMDPTERRICNTLLTAIFARPENLFVRVFDGEEWATDWTRERGPIMAQTAATDETRWFLMKVDPATSAARRIGSILLIHGNYEDVISDASWNPVGTEAKQIIDAVTAEAAA